MTLVSRALVTAVAASVALPMTAAAGTLKTLYTFTGGADGAYPIGGLVVGYLGNYYGTTALGGSGCNGFGCGTVFQLTPPAAGKTAWTFSTIYTFFGGTDGQQPVNLIALNGRLFGVATYGGVSPVLCTVGGTVLGCGTVFEMAPPAAGQTEWTFTALYNFTGGADGSFPNYGLAMDSTGALYGFANGGGTCVTLSCGTAFKLTPPAAGQSVWTETTLWDFKGGADGSAPYAAPLLDASGHVYGTTATGGYTKSAVCQAAGGCGTVFQLTPPAAGSSAWTKKVLAGFTGANGLYPQGTLTADSSGNLYGTTNLGGNLTACLASGTIPPGCGTVFELSPPVAGSTAWKLKTAYAFGGGSDGLYPAAGLTPRSSSYFTTTSGNGIKGFGSVVALNPPAAGSTGWSQATSFDFTNDANGSQPTDTLLLRGGVLYGTTLGHDGPAPARYGTIFSVVP